MTEPHDHVRCPRCHRADHEHTEACGGLCFVVRVDTSHPSVVKADGDVVWIDPTIGDDGERVEPTISGPLGPEWREVGYTVEPSVTVPPSVTLLGEPFDGDTPLVIGEPVDLAAAIRQGVQDMLLASYEPTGLILHPVDEGMLHASSLPTAEERREAGLKIAEAFDVVPWMIGVEGERPPWPYRFASWRRRLPRRILTALPGVTRPGRRETGEGWMNDAEPEARAGRWFLHVGNYLIGTRPEREDVW